MSQLFDTGEFACDPAALITYLYGEGSEAERDAMAAHVAGCVACAEEIALLGSTRQQLAAWTPPVARTLGFQITRAEASDARDSGPSQGEGAMILRPAAWWNRPLPAWAQAAAAVLIFGAGLAIGTARTGAPTVPQRSIAAAPASPASAPVAATPAARAASREELAQLEQRLTSEIAQMRAVSAQAPRGADTQAVLQRVNQLIAASEDRQRRELAFRTQQMMGDVNSQRIVDLSRIEQRMEGIRTITGVQQQDLGYLKQRVALGGR